MKRLIEGLWDCEYCQTKGIRGGKRECPNCHNVRNEKTKFYMPEKIECVSENIEKDVNMNPDWVCSYCKNLNPDDSKNCLSCGAARTSENLNYFENKDKQEKVSNDTITTDVEFCKEEPPKEEKPQNNDISEQQKNKEGRSIKLKNFVVKNSLKIGIGLIIVIITGIILLLIPKEKQLTVTQVSWNYVIKVEEYKIVEENDWQLPPDAQLMYEREEIYEYEQRLDHYETKTRTVVKQRIAGYQDYVAGERDLGNGYFQEIIEQKPIYEDYTVEEKYEEPVYISVPVYKPKYYYQINKWVYSRDVITNGNNKKPYWGDVELHEKEREGSKKQEYYITGIDNDGEIINKIELSYQQWKDINIEDEIKVKISRTGKGRVIQ